MLTPLIDELKSHAIIIKATKHLAVPELQGIRATIWAAYIEATGGSAPIALDRMNGNRTKEFAVKSEINIHILNILKCK